MAETPLEEVNCDGNIRAVVESDDGVCCFSRREQDAAGPAKRTHELPLAFHDPSRRGVRPRAVGLPSKDRLNHGARLRPDLRTGHANVLSDRPVQALETSHIVTATSSRTPVRDTIHTYI